MYEKEEIILVPTQAFFYHPANPVPDLTAKVTFVCSAAESLFKTLNNLRVHSRILDKKVNVAI